MVGGQCRGHHGFDLDAVAVREHARRDSSNGKDSALRRIDDRDEAIDAEHAEIRHCKSSAFVVEGEEVFCFAPCRPARGSAWPIRPNSSRSALRITGTTRPSSRATATPMLISACCWIPCSVKLAFMDGKSLSARAQAWRMKSLIDGISSSPRSFHALLSLLTAVMSMSMLM